MNKGTKIIWLGRNSLSTNGAGTNRYPVQKNEVGTLTHTIHKNYLKIDQILNKIESKLLNS